MLRRKNVEEKLIHYCVIALGCFIASCSINLFLIPSKLLTGGVTGIAIIMYYLASIPVGLQTMLYNIPLLLASWKFMGRWYTIDVVIGTALFSFCLDLTRGLNAYALLDDIMLSCIFGGVFTGIGYGIVFRMGGSTGGFDILGAIIRKYYSLHMGGVIFAFNCMLMVVAGFLFGAAPAMFTLISMYTSATVTDKVIAGFNKRQAVLIISDRARIIADEIMVEVKRGVTFLHAQGAYSHNERNVVFVAVTLTQLAQVKYIVNAVDKKAFMIIMPASEVAGKGFTLPAK